MKRFKAINFEHDEGEFVKYDDAKQQIDCLTESLKELFTNKLRSNKMEELDMLIEDIACTIQRLTNEIDEPNDFGNTPEENYLAMLDKLQEWKKLRFTHEVLIHLRSTVKDNKES